MDERLSLTATELARRIRAREFSASEVVEAHLTQIARHHPIVNAVVTVDGAGARQRARAADAALVQEEVWGPLHGVPFTVKDYRCTAGLRTTWGLASLADYVPPVDAAVVARLKAAGGVLLGKTNAGAPESGYETDNAVFGRTNNPWDPGRTAGASSGGAAAALATGMTPLDIGTDLGGSLRNPAHYCGVWALKPTEHLVPTTNDVQRPDEPRGLRHLWVYGPMARSPEDLALAQRLIAGPDLARPEVPPVPLAPMPIVTLRGLRVAWTDDFGGVPVDAETRTALASLAEALARRGCQVARGLPEDFDATAAWEAWGAVYQAEYGAAMSAEEEATTAASGVSADAANPVLRGQARTVGATMRQYILALHERDALTAAMERFLTEWDALLCPVTSGPAFTRCPVGTPLEIDGRPVEYWLANEAYTLPFNLTGQPAVTLPLPRTRAGLPLGIQLVGRRWDDMRLLGTASAVAALLPPCELAPGY